MITGNDFVWLHFPKCAGTAVEAALRTLLADRQDVVFDALDYSKVIWHHSIDKRVAYDPKFRLGQRRIICCFRRLPTWLLSRVHFEAARPPDYRTPTRKMLVKGRFYEQDGIISSAEEYAVKYSEPKVHTWIRAEHLANDLSAAFGLDLAAVQQAVRARNGTDIPYIKPITFWFTDEELRSLYEANPTWARIERKVYGSLLLSGKAARLRNTALGIQ